MRVLVWVALVLAIGAAPLLAQDDGDSVVVTADEIAKLQARRVPDVLNHVPGVSASSSSVSIQGSYKVKVFVDGRPINDPSSSFGAIEWDLVRPEDVQTIEIHRGKGAVKYGQDASSGVILITTKGTRALTGNVRLYGGNQSTWNSTFNVSNVWGKLNGGVTGSYETSDGYAVNNDKARWRGGLKLGYDVDQTDGVLLTTDFVDDRRGLSGYPDFPTPFARRTSQLSNSALRIRHRVLSSTTTFVSSTSRNTDSALALDRSLRVSELGESVAADRRSPRWGTTSYGASMVVGRASGSVFGHKQEESWSLFAVQALPKTRLPGTYSLGVRATINSAFGDAVNPEVKAAFGHKQRKVTVAYNRSNNTPSFQQRYNETSTTKPNPDLEMETAHNVSATIAATGPAGLSSELGGFYNQLRNRITYVLGSTGTGRYLNLGNVVYAGTDASVTWKPGQPVTLKGDYSYLDAHDEATGLQLPGKSRHSGSVTLQYAAGESFSTSLVTEYVSRAYRDTRNTIVLNPRWLTDVRSEIVRGRTTAFVEISNLLNRSYLYSDGLLAPPRTWFVGLNYKL